VDGQWFSGEEEGERGEGTEGNDGVLMGRRFDIEGRGGSGGVVGSISYQRGKGKPSEVWGESDMRVPPIRGLHLLVQGRERGQIPFRVRLVGRVAGPDWTTPVQTSFLFFFFLSFILFCFLFFSITFAF
jgi:hypothetical protein